VLAREILLEEIDTSRSATATGRNSVQLASGAGGRIRAGFAHGKIASLP